MQSLAVLYYEELSGHFKTEGVQLVVNGAFHGVRLLWKCNIFLKLNLKLLAKKPQRFSFMLQNEKSSKLQLIV